MCYSLEVVSVPRQRLKIYFIYLWRKLDNYFILRKSIIISISLCSIFYFSPYSLAKKHLISFGCISEISFFSPCSYIILPHELNGNGKSASGSGRGDAGMLDMEMMCIPQNLRTASGAKCPHCFLQHGQLIFTTSSNLTLL